MGGNMKSTCLAILLFLALGAPSKADSVSVQQTPFDGFFGISTPIPNVSSGLLLFPGPYQLTFQTIPSTQTNSFVVGILDVSQMKYGAVGTVDVLGPNGFQLSGSFTDAISEIFTNTVPLPGFPVGSVVGFLVTGDFTGLLNDGEQWQGMFGVDKNLCCDELSPSFLKMSGPVATPEPGIFLSLCAGMLSVGLLRKRLSLRPSDKPRL
jgi:hypothetical protein